MSQTCQKFFFSGFYYTKVYQGHLAVIKKERIKTLDTFATLTPEMTSGFFLQTQKSRNTAEFHVSSGKV